MINSTYYFIWHAVIILAIILLFLVGLRSFAILIRKRLMDKSQLTRIKLRNLILSVFLILVSSIYLFDYYKYRKPGQSFIGYLHDGGLYYYVNGRTTNGLINILIILIIFGANLLYFRTLLRRRKSEVESMKKNKIDSTR